MHFKPTCLGFLVFLKSTAFACGGFLDNAGEFRGIDEELVMPLVILLPMLGLFLPSLIAAGRDRVDFDGFPAWQKTRKRADMMMLTAASMCIFTVTKFG